MAILKPAEHYVILPINSFSRKMKYFNYNEKTHIEL